MSSLLIVNSAITGSESVSIAVAEEYADEWRSVHPDGTVVIRDLAADPLPYLTFQDNLAKTTPAAEQSPETRLGAARSAMLVDEVLAADVVVITAPLYNYGIAATLKTWLDHILADPRNGAGAMFAGKDIVVISARGGSYREGTPREGMDFAIPYLQHILGVSLGATVTYLEPELTLATRVPAMAELIPLAERSRAEVSQRAIEHARATAA